ncbi:MAG: hypothetical protein ABIH53_03070 [archaeon]
MEQGIPKEVLRELDIKQKEKEGPKTVTAIVEEHQAKLPIPSYIRFEIKLKKGQKFKVRLDKDNREIIYKF